MTAVILHDSIVPDQAQAPLSICSVCRAAYTEPCRFCGGAHHVQHCAALNALLCSNAVLPPRILARLLCSHRALAYAFLEGLPVLLLAEQADVLAAWQERYLAEADADALLNRWMQQFHDVPTGRAPRYELLAA
jgi:hypothetical protein